MSFPSDLDIARAAVPQPIPKVAGKMGIGEHLLRPYGTELAKISLDAIDELADRPKAKYVVVTAITPTPLGEGKTKIAFRWCDINKGAGRGPSTGADSSARCPSAATP